MAGVNFASIPANLLYYLPGETIEISVQFTADVQVAGSPTFALTIGDDTRQAAFESVSDNVVAFAYTVVTADSDLDGAGYSADQIVLGTGDNITGLDGTTKASLSHTASLPNPIQRVNPSVVTISTDHTEPVPEDETVMFTLSRTGDLSGALTVNVTYAEKGRFVSGYRRLPTTITFQAEESTAQWDVGLINDADKESEDGRITATVESGDGYLLGTPNAASVDLTDNNDVTVIVDVGVSAVTVKEAEGATVGINFTLVTSAHRDTPPDRFFLAATTVPGQARADGFRMDEHGNYIRDENGRAIIFPGDYITSLAHIVFRPEDLCSQGSSMPDSGLVDYGCWSKRDLSTPNNPDVEWVWVLTYSIEIRDDEVVEPPETFTWQVQRHPSTPTNLVEGLFPFVSTVTIVDDERAYHIEVVRQSDIVQPSDPEAVEGESLSLDVVEGDPLNVELVATGVNPISESSVLNKSLNFWVDLDCQTTPPTTDCPHLGDTADHPEDFKLGGTGNVSVHQVVSVRDFERVEIDGETYEVSRTAVLPIDAVDDDEVEEAERFTLAFSPLLRGLHKHVTFEFETISVGLHDNDSPNVSVAADVEEIFEGDDVVFTLTRANTDLALTVSLEVTESTSFIDFAGGLVLPETVEFAAGQSQVSFTIPTEDDRIGDGPGGITVQLLPPLGLDPGEAYSYTEQGRTVTVAVNETEPVLTFADVIVDESAGTAELVVGLSNDGDFPVSFSWQTASAPGDQAAEEDSDYTAASGTVVVPIGTTTATLTVPILHDVMDEFDEDFVVVLSNVADAYAPDREATVQITDDDDPPEFTIVNAEDVVEGKDATEGGGPLVFKVRLDRVSGKPISVDWFTKDGSAKLGSDYRFSRLTPSETLSFPAGTKRKDVSIFIEDDDIDEARESLTVNLKSAVNASIDRKAALGYIDDDDAVAMSADDATVSESGETTQVIVRMDHVSDRYISVDVRTADLTTADLTTGDAAATAGLDYTALTLPTLTFAPGTTAMAVDIPILGDPMVEPDESFFVELANPVDATVGEGEEARGKVTILDDDVLPTLSVGRGAAAYEDEGPLVTIVRRYGEADVLVMVDWATTTTPGTATAGTDYTSASGTVMLQAGVTEAEVSIPLLDDDIVEGRESFGVELSNPQGATIAGGSGVGTILDDDSPGLVVEPAEVSLVEDSSLADAYTVALTLAPSADVTVSIAARAASDVSASPSTLTFTTGNWATTQAVTVTAGQDDDTVDDIAFLDHTASGGGYDAATATVRVSVTDPDIPALMASPTEVLVDEGGTNDDAYAVKLATQPVGNVTVTITGTAGTDLSVSPSSLTFTADNWAAYQHVTLTAADDQEVDGVETVTLVHAAAGGGYASAPSVDVKVSITDDDTVEPGLVVRPAAVTVPEGSAASYTVALREAPTGDVTVSISGDAAELTLLGLDEASLDGTPLEGAELTFTVDDWSVPQTVALNARYDADTDDDVVRLTHAAAGGGYDSIEADVVVTVIDTEARAVVAVEPAEVSVDEGRTLLDAYTVVLESQPTGDVTVTVSGHVGTDVDVDTDDEMDDPQQELTFTTENWLVPQPVAVTAAQDDDAVADEVALAHDAAGGGYELAPSATVDVMVRETDVPGVRVRPTAMLVDEGDPDGESYEVVLNTQPSVDATVAVSKVGPSSGELSLSTTSLTFTATDWDTAQTVTVWAAHDDDATGDDPVSLTHTVSAASGSEYEGVTADSVSVSIREDDLPALVVSPSKVSVHEGASNSYNVSLATEPSGPVTVTVSGHAGTDASLSPSSLTFTVDNWSVLQSVTVTAAEETGADNDAVDDEVELVHTALGADYGGVVASVDVTVLDNDTPVVSILPLTQDVAEGVGSASLAVELDIPSSKEVSVRWATADGNEAGTVKAAVSSHDYDSNGATVTFEPEQTSQTVTVMVTNDVLDEDDERFFVALTGTPVNATMSTTDVIAEVIIEDDDPLPRLSINDAEANEGDGVEFTVTLDKASGREVTVDYATADITGNPASATAGVDYTSVNTTTTNDPLVFAAGETEKTITVETLGDSVDEGDEIFQVTLTGRVNADQLDLVGQGTIKDDDSAGVTVSPPSLSLEEGAGAKSYTVVLTSEPSADVTVTVEGWSGTDVVVDTDGVTQGAQDELTFTAADWNTAQTVAVTAARDDDAVDDKATITHTVSSSDTGYNEIGAPDVEVTVIDNDTPTVSVSDAAADEDGSVEFEVTLNVESSKQVTVDYATSDLTTNASAVAGTDYTATSGTLLFAAGDMSKTITISLVDDLLDEDDETFTLTLSNPGNADLDGSGTTLAATGTIRDNDDTPELSLSPTNLTVTEGAVANGGNITFTVTLSGASGRTVTVSHRHVDGTAVQGDDKDYVSVPDALVFSPGDTSKTFTVRILDDEIDEEEPEQFTIELHLPTNATIAAGEATLAINDNDPSEGIRIGDATAVAEGGALEFTVSLDKASERTVKVDWATETTHATAEAGQDYTAAGGTLTFAPGDTSKTVTVGTIDDALDEDDETVVVRLTQVTDGNGIVLEDRGDGTITDDDPEPSLSIGDASAEEGESVTFTVALTPVSGRAVTVDYATSNGTATSADYTAANGSLTFAAGETTKTVTVATAEDTVDEDDETFTVTLSNPGNALIGDAGATGTIEDDDTAGLTVSPTTLTVDEGESDTYTVVLDTEPTGDVTVAVGGASGDVTASPTPLTFTPTNWNTAQTVTVNAAKDADAVDDKVTLEHSVSGGDYAGMVAPSVEVTVIDLDTAGVTISPLALHISEGNSAGYTVVLDTEPTADVTVTVDGHSGTDVSLSGSTLNNDGLTFTTTTWATPQSVTVTAGPDADGLNDSETLTHAVSGGDYGSVSAEDVAVTVYDDELFTATPPEVHRPTVNVYPTPTGLRVDPLELTIEEGGSATYLVSMTAEPSSTVTFTVNDPGHPDIDADSTTLEFTFTVDNWDTPRTVTVYAAEDDDAVPDRTGINHDIVGGGFNIAGMATVVVTVTENDTAGVTVTPTMLTVVEGGSGTYTVVLDTEPTGDVTVTVGGASGDVTVSDTTLTFTTSNWGTAQTVTVSAAEDDDAIADAPVTLTHTVSGGDYGSVTASSVVVTVTENDTAAVTVTPTELTVDEGESGTYTVVLDTEPTGDVAVTVGGASGDVTVSPTPLTFTTANWGTAQTVTVSAGQDDDAIADPAVTLTHTVTGGGYSGITVSDVEVTVTENDTAAVTVTPTMLTVVEGGSGTYTVVLDTEPTGDVAVTVGGASGDVTVSPTPLTFTTANWGTAQTVTVSAAEDDDAIADPAVTLTHTVTGGGYSGITVSDVEVTVTENDTAAVTVTPTMLTVVEGGSGTYTVVLDTEPTGDVAVTVGGASGDVTVSPTPLTFTTANWGTAQTVTVSAAEDDDAIADPAVTLTHTVTGGGYSGITVSDVVVTVTENDTAGVTVTPTMLTVVEGESGTYTVVLDTEPTGDVAVTVGGVSGDVTVSPTPLTFTTANWGTAQTVTVSAGQDDDAIADPAVTLTHTVTGGGYSGITVSDVVVTVTDNDTAGVTVTPTMLTVVEGESGTYTVVLDTEPTGDVTVTVGGVSGDVTVSDTTLTFTTSNWGTTQTVTVSAGQDDDAVADAAVTLTHTVTGGGYSAITVSDVEVTVTENDTAGVTVTPTMLTVVEGESGTYTVVLDTEPTGDVTVTVGGVSGDVTVSDTTLTFTTSNWGTAQTVTVSAGEDGDPTDDSVTLTHTVTGGGYSGITVPDVVVTVEDDDTQPPPVTDVEVSFGASRYTAAEGGTGATVTACLTAAYGSEASVGLTVDLQGGASAGDYSGVPSQLVFGSSDTCTTFTVSAVDNSVEDAGRSIVLGFGRLPAGFSAKSPATATVDLVDDDTPPPSADLTIATGLVTCAATYISVTLADMSAGVEYTVYLRWRKSGDGWPSSPTHERRLSDSSPGGRADATVVLTDLDGDATYEVQASLDRAFASGVETVSFTTEAEEPDPPTQVRVIGDTADSLTLRWVAPEYDGGDDIIEYKVGWVTAGQHFAAAALAGQQVKVDATTGQNTYTYTITGLDEATFYMVRVLAVNGAGDSYGSNRAWGFSGLGSGQYGFTNLSSG